MSDLVLQSRIDVLDQNLDRVATSLDLVESFKVGAPVFPDDMRERVRQSVDVEINRYKKEVGAIRQILAGQPSEAALADAWNHYQLIRDNSQEIFSGCLEFIAGYAFRQNFDGDDVLDPEHRVWRIADRLIAQASDGLIGSNDGPYLTVPALQEVLSMSRVRTIRLRFPEWTVWTLPLLAYDFGHVAINRYVLGAEGEAPLRDLVESQKEAYLQKSLSHQQQLSMMPTDEARDRLQRRAEKWARHRVRVLLADALATHWMGPAYACASLYLGFDPSVASTGDPSYEQRAKLVTARLRATAEGAEQAEIIDRFEQDWRQAVQRADPPPATAVDDVDPVAMLLPALKVTLGDLPSVSGFGQPSWRGAMQLKAEWEKNVEERRVLKSNLEPSKIRDVLNAAWLTRLDHPDLVAQLTPVVVHASSVGSAPR